MTFHELGHTSVIRTRPWWLRPTHLNPTLSQLYHVPLLCPPFPDWRSSSSQIIKHSPSPSDNGQQVCRRCLLCQVKLETILSPMITLCFCYGQWTYMINLAHTYFAGGVMTSTPNTRSRRLSNSSQQVCFNERPHQICLCHHPAGCFCLWAIISKSGKWRKSFFCDNIFKIGQKLIS